MKDMTSVGTLREGVGALEEVAMMTGVVTFHAMTIAGVAMADGGEKKWRDGGKVMPEVVKYEKWVLCKLLLLAKGSVFRG